MVAKAHKHICGDCHKKVKCWFGYCADPEGPRAYLCDSCIRDILEEIQNDPSRPRILDE